MFNYPVGFCQANCAFRQNGGGTTKILHVRVCIDRWTHLYFLVWEDYVTKVISYNYSSKLHKYHYTSIYWKFHSLCFSFQSSQNSSFAISFVVVVVVKWILQAAAPCCKIFHCFNTFIVNKWTASNWFVTRNFQALSLPGILLWCSISRAIKKLNCNQDEFIWAEVGLCSQVQSLMSRILQGWVWTGTHCT